MNHTNTHTNNDACATRGRQSPPSFYPLRAPAAWQVREEGDSYVHHPLENEDPVVALLAIEHTRRLRDTQKLIGDAQSLMGVLLDAVEQDGSTRAEQTRAVLGFTVECLHKAHQLIDEQEARDQKLYVAYVALKDEADDGEDVGPPPLDD